MRSDLCATFVAKLTKPNIRLFSFFKKSAKTIVLNLLPFQPKRYIVFEKAEP